MLVREGMNEIVVTVGPDHTLREAARRMDRHNVGAAVVMDNEQSGPGIITERDLLRSIGRDEDIDSERVGDHLASHLIYAHADWPLEQAAKEMAKGHFRHVIVLDTRGDPVGILSMRDIVRCWVSDGATCDVPPDRANV
ncbi:MAG: CBS domain-containing protein [Nocardioides sp.]